MDPYDFASQDVITGDMRAKRRRRESLASALLRPRAGRDVQGYRVRAARRAKPGIALRSRCKQFAAAPHQATQRRRHSKSVR